MYSQFGIVCDTCAPGKAPDSGYTICDEIGETTEITDVFTVVEILNGTVNIRPVTTVEVLVEAGVLVDGSEAQIAFVEQMAFDIASSTQIQQSDIRIAVKEVLLDGRRRVQVADTAPRMAQIEIEITASDRAAALVQLAAALADETGTLQINSLLSPINTASAITYKFTCPPGMLRQPNAADCAKCPGKNEYLRDSTCQDCVQALGLEPNSLGDGCVCMRGWYDSTVWNQFAVTCYTGDFFGAPRTHTRCIQCDKSLECISECNPSGALEADTVLGIDEGWRGMVQPSGALSVFLCTGDTDSCLAGEALATECGEGYSGITCGSCAETYSRNTDGSCEECGSWTVLGAIAALAGLVFVLVAMLLIRQWYATSSLLINSYEVIQELELKAISKVWLATIQILGALPTVLSLHLPESFRAFLRVISTINVFGDLSLFGFGCITHGQYLPSLLTNTGLILLVLTFIVTVYAIETKQFERKAAAQSTDEDDVRKLFNEFDKDGDGIGVDELATIIGKVESGSSKQTSREEIQSIFEEADADGGGLIGFDEFKAAINPSDNDGSTDVSLQKGLAKVVLKYQQSQAKANMVGRLFLTIFLVCKLLQPSIL